MCGLFGMFTAVDAGYPESFIRKAFHGIARLSESRGKDSSGVAVRDAAAGTFHVVKGDVPISDLLRSPEYRGVLARIFDGASGAGETPRPPFAAMGHARLVTNGSQLRDENNQPVVKDGIMAIHNGIIVNEEQLWAAHPSLRRSYEIDTEVMLALCRCFLSDGNPLPIAVSKCLSEIFGTVSTAMFFDDLDQAVLATNNGSLYTLTNGRDVLFFASEGFFLKDLSARLRLRDVIGPFTISQVKPRTGFVVDFHPFQWKPFALSAPVPLDGSRAASPSKRTIEVSHVTGRLPRREVVVEVRDLAATPRAAFEESLLEDNAERIKSLKRCTRCILPETFPFIEFDEEGVCNFCRHHKPKNQPKPLDRLLELVAPYRSRDGSPDCLVPFSGGRDSTFTLHTVKNVLKLNPIAFTYDWGMVTDLGRRNIARACGKMGVENILVSADIHWKRGNIRRNIEAWLKNPALGMVPLFMAGDKFFFYYCDKVKRQTGIRLNIWGINPLENTEFKVGFCGLPPDFEKERIYSLSKSRQIKLFGYVGRNILASPGYINRSVWDTLGSFAVRYLAPRRDYYHMFDYVRWDEREIEALILNEYDWETAVDTKTTWRIGDGTVAFYNYVYYTAAGFSEYDTFRSNQIREGMMDRDRALALVEDENRPRYRSIKWYTEIVGLDFETTMKRINRIPKLYP